VVAASEDEMVADVEIWADDKPRARASARWLRWRPR
jgi:hypothetical protein